MIGDRLLTDVAYGNLNKMLTIYVEPFDVTVEPLGVKLVKITLSHTFEIFVPQGRRAENQLWEDCKRQQLQV